MNSQHLLSGFIVDENDSPVPFAKVFVKNQPELRTIADVNGYYEMRLQEGEYFLVIRAGGFIEKEAFVAITGKGIKKDIQLFPIEVQELEDVEIKAKKTNPGREIMLKVVKKRNEISMWSYPHKVNVYIKASEEIFPQKNNKRDKGNKEEVENKMNLIEVSLERSYGGKGKVKEIRKAFRWYGDKYNHHLYYTTTVKSDFNFFQNILHLDDLHQNPISSPISVSGILSYKYRLVDQYEENNKKIHKIQIIPRNIASTTLGGFIYVIDSLWLVKKIDFEIEKGNLLIYDYFKITQEFDTRGDSVSILKKQLLDYGVKYKSETYKGKTIASFENYDFSPKFPKRYFNSELAVMTEDALDKDSSYWEKKRKSGFTKEELEYIQYRDSIEIAHQRKEYLDSIDREFNKITFWKVVWWGIDHRNRAKKEQWTIGSLATTIRPIFIAGPRISPNFYYFKKWENEHVLDGYTEVSIGVLNKDPKVATTWEYLYNPFKAGEVGIGFFHYFDVIRDFDAITQIYKRDNFIEVTKLNGINSIEISNGFYLDLGFEFSERRSLEGYQFLNTDDFLPNNDPLDFETYQALILAGEITFVPFQKYMREPKRKIVLGSRWPTFYLAYEKGVPSLLGSDVDHDYIKAGIRQTFKIGTVGTSSYHLKTGKFLNTKSLKYADEKFHRRSDPIWFSNPLYSFQGLDTIIAARDISYEAHFVHHGNGAILSKIPLMKKTRIGLVLGTGGMYIPEFDWINYEVLAGLERNFKFSKRRLRVGFYTALSGGNHMIPRLDWKISLALLNNRNMKWNF